ncbi:hypothetical protein P175DRAFT_0532130 [Aspergillus ochraceoroseus IBT 24754]|uniref:Acyl-CoA thioesterase II n=2 Tax=Aspergillus ochraceoroseus TaxID=138278 RepID=A0A2T5LWX1_9EURO|nr:uncharacterized protein P175DRAFT_0532130 [Aspergillus ochraceoroseus IBT 24754]KKK18253.1 hypothetical protein AOCH_001947 [Aspergillus ochraceoroseus]PTU20779.1 hypothetical protein P175DRAFT_0532130 [Aspergillus ochraceoroseus IBT 24754]
MAAITPTGPLSFAQVMELEKVSSEGEVYMSKYPAISFDYQPGKPLSAQRSYGGHVFAQSIWAASLPFKDSGLQVHEANGYWTQGGHGNRPFLYTVTTLSETRSFVLRQVTARQPTTLSDDCPFPTTDASKPFGPVAFALTCSLKRREDGPAYGVSIDAERYGDVLRRDPTTHASDFYLPGLNRVGKARLVDFPGIDIRTPDLTDYNSHHTGTGHRRLHVYRALSAMDVDSDMSAAAHAFVSDRAGLSVLTNAFGANHLGVAGSLNHKIVFHVNPDDLKLDDTTWFIQEMSSPRGGEGRGAIESRIWGPSGILVASTMQDAMYRTPLPSKLS